MEQNLENKPTFFNCLQKKFKLLLLTAHGVEGFWSRSPPWFKISPTIHRSNARLPSQPLPISLQVCCQLSTLFQCESPISTACNPATGALPALYLVPTRVSHFNCLQYGYRCVASSLHHSDARLPFQQLAISLQVCCRLSWSFQRASPISTTCNMATGALPSS